MPDNSINNLFPDAGKIAGFPGLINTGGQDTFVNNEQNNEQFNQLEARKEQGRGSSLIAGDGGCVRWPDLPNPRPTDRKQLTEKELTRLRSTLTQNVKKAKSLNDIKDRLHKKIIVRIVANALPLGAPLHVAERYAENLLKDKNEWKKWSPTILKELNNMTNERLRNLINSFPLEKPRIEPPIKPPITWPPKVVAKDFSGVNELSYNSYAKQEFKELLDILDPNSEKHKNLADREKRSAIQGVLNNLKEIKRRAEIAIKNYNDAARRGEPVHMGAIQIGDLMVIDQLVSLFEGSAMLPSLKAVQGIIDGKDLFPDWITHYKSSI